MGSYRHHAIIVTSQFLEDIAIIWKQSRKVISKMLMDSKMYDDELEGGSAIKKEMLIQRDLNLIVSDTSHGLINGFYTFIIYPDGSKEGWEDSDMMDGIRKALTEAFQAFKQTVDFVEISYGGDVELYGTPEIISYNKKEY